MSHSAVVNITVEDVVKSIVEEIMDDLGWDGKIVEVIGTTVFLEGAGNICMGASERKQEKLIRDTFNKKLGKEVYISIFWRNKNG